MNSVFETFYGGQSISRPSCEINTEYKIYFNYFNDKKIFLNNVSLENNLNTILDSDYHIWIFAINKGSTSFNNYKSTNTRIFECKITDSNSLIRDFVPCYRKSDGVIGMYDIVTQEFYTNAGSGTFLKGDDVN